MADLRSLRCLLNDFAHAAQLWLRRFPLIAFLCIWILSAFISSSTTWNVGLVGSLSILLTVAFVGLASFYRARVTFSKPLVQVCLAFPVVFSVGLIYYELNAPPQSDSLSVLAQRKSQPCALRGVIVEAAVWSPNPYHRPTDPLSEPWATRWVVQWQELRDQHEWLPIASQSNLRTVGRHTELLPGDLIEVFGDLTAIVPPTNPGAHDFARMARFKGMFVTVSADHPSQIKKLESTWRFPIQRVRGMAVRSIDQALQSYITLDQADLAAALVFGQREQVDWQSQQELMATGTLHMLAISGMHVEIVAATLLVLGRLLGLRRGMLASILILGCSAYAVLAGSNPPVLRALIVIVGITAARYFGYPVRLFNLLALAGLLLVWDNAGNLVNIGVQLSFLAVVTIAIVNRAQASSQRDALQSLLEESLPAWRRSGLSLFRYAASGLRVSFWVGLMTTPLIWQHFHVVSLVSVLLNLLLAPPLMVGLLSGVLAGLLGCIPGVGLVLGTVFGAVSGLCLALIRLMVGWASSIPLGHFWLPAPPLWWSLIFYLAVIIWLLAFRDRHRKFLGLLLVLWLATGLSLYAFGPRGFFSFCAGASVAHVGAASGTQPEFRCTFLDVGHGTSVMLELPDGRVWLYDAGHMGQSDRSHEHIAGGLWSLPTARIDTLLISHADADHYNASPGLLQRFQVGRVVGTRRFWESESSEVRQLLRAIDGRGIRRETWNSTSSSQQILGVSGDSQIALQSPVASSQFSITVLHPTFDFHAETDNADSLCLQIDYAGVRLLLPGDIEGSGMLALCDLPPRDCEIIMAPHHGSVAFDPTTLLDWCHPETVVISGNNRATRPKVLAKYASAEQLGITFLHGAIQVRISHDGTVSTHHWKHDRWVELSDLP